MVCVTVGVGRGVVRAIGITSKMQGYLWFGRTCLKL
jgi:hypothetical protein